MRLLILCVFSFCAGFGFAEDAAPPSPFKKEAAGQEERPGWLQTSDGTVRLGAIRTTLGKPVTVYDRAHKKYHRLPWSDIAAISVAIDIEELQPDWRWKENGSDVKVYTGLYYFWHQYLTTVTLKNGDVISGDVSAPIYLLPDGADERERFILHKRNKGEKAKKEEAKRPLYVRMIVLTDIDGAKQPPQQDGEADAADETAAPDEDAN